MQVQIGESYLTNTVLVVEDDATQMQILSDLLSRNGFKVITAKNGSEGLQSATENRPDLILLDNRMTEMTGFEMMKHLRGSGDWGAKVPVIFLTNVVMESEEESEDIASTGPAYYLVKADTDLNDLVSKIKSLVH